MGATGAAVVCLAVFGAAPGLVSALLALVLFGPAIDMSEVAAVSCFQRWLPHSLNGRFFSLILVASGAGGLLGARAGPLLAGRVRVRSALGLPTVPVVALAE